MKKNKWIKQRHVFFTRFARLILSGHTKKKYNVDIKPFHAADNRQFLILFNHQTAYDQFFLGMAFKNPIYYLATEDLFSMGFLSKLLTFAVAPIPIKKQTTDLNAIKTLISVANEGGTIAIAPEGQRTYSGKTTYINPAIVTMAKKLNLPIAIFLIRGGYGVQPRWSDVVRSGKMSASVERVIEPEEYNKLSKDEFISLINEAMEVNEASYDGEYQSDRLAEYLERVFYICPYCGLSSFISIGNEVTCLKCNNKIKYNPDKTFEGIEKAFPYKYVLEWYGAQEDYLNSLDLREYTNSPVYEEAASFYKVIVYKRKELIDKNISISLYGDKIKIHSNKVDMTFYFNEVKAVTILGKNKINIYTDKDFYQVKGNEHFNGLKYVHFYNRYKNILEGKNDVKFLGL